MPQCLLCGVSIEQFWEYTLNDINMILKADRERRKEQLMMEYQQASLTAYFIGLSFNGKSTPSIEEIYPDIFRKSKPQQEKEMQLYKEQFIDFALANNAKRRQEATQ